MTRREELSVAPGAGRVFEGQVRGGLADCAPDGRVRLDAIARWLQEVGYADIDDAALVDDGAWVVRRTRIRVERFPRFDERLPIATFCSGLGRLWAERRTSVPGCLEAVALWIQLDHNSGRPLPLGARFLAAYEASAAGRRVKARLRHPALPERPHAEGRWVFRRTELDVAQHINNAAYWTVLEEELLAGGGVPRLPV
ncbi:MAG TPA: acyl-ACP thioesterase domain-containing protein, partial [Solirubrobacteraceae bacterium]|nr:acyl-ACP thioesterase domain-containing protein [Solirubrobacteraceae bacterium]